ncbi:ankyrin, partial [Colletotrichum falcatum]
MLLYHRADVQAPEGYPLHAAAANGHTAIVKLLLDNHADPNSFTDHCVGGYALQEACAAGNIETAKVLLDKDANPNRGAGELFSPLTAATYRANGDLVKLLLGKGADPNLFGGPSNSYGTALHAAAAGGHAPTCRLLLEKGANPKQLGGPYLTAIQAAAASGEPDCVKAILDHAPDLPLDEYGGTHYSALHAAAVQNNDKCLRLLLERNRVELDVVPKPKAPRSTIG